jgi:hypothetical protein
MERAFPHLLGCLLVAAIVAPQGCPGGNGAAPAAPTSPPIPAPNWTFLGAPTLTQVDLGVQFLAIDPRDETTMYVGTSLGTYVTRNGGGSWERPLTSFAGAVALDPFNPDRVYAITGAHALMRSTDRGATFQAVHVFDDGIISLHLSARAPGTIYLGFGGLNNPNPSGTFKSVDDGAMWVRQPFGVSGPLIVWTIAEDPVDGTLYAGTEIANHPQPYHPPFFRSIDGGQTWTDVSAGLPWHVILSTVKANRELLALTEGSGLYSTTDQARTWTSLNNDFRSALLVDPLNQVRVFGGDQVLSGQHDAAFASVNSARTFVSYGLPGLQVADLALNGTSTRLYAACYNSGIYVTDVPHP